jgi:hypothetical protein
MRERKVPTLTEVRWKQYGSDQHQSGIRSLAFGLFPDFPKKPKTEDQSPSFSKFYSQKLQFDSPRTLVYASSSICFPGEN